MWRKEVNWGIVFYKWYLVLFLNILWKICVCNVKYYKNRIKVRNDSYINVFFIKKKIYK